MLLYINELFFKNFLKIIFKKYFYHYYKNIETKIIIETII